MTMICPHCQHVTTSGKYCQDCGLPLPPPAGGNTGDIVAIGSTIIAGNTVIAAGDWPGTRVVAECPKCGTRNDVDKTFKCKRCGVDNLCLRHLNHDFDLCEYCVQASIESRKGRTTGIRIGRRAALVGAGGFGAISLAWLTLKGGDLFGLAPPVPPIATPTATNPSPTSTPTRAPTSTSMPPTATSTSAPTPTHSATPKPAVLILGADKASLTLAQGIPIDFVRVPAGEFLMGSDKARDPQAYDDETLQHAIRLPEYWIGATEVTVAQFEVFSKTVGYQYPFDSVTRRGATRPMSELNWDDCLAFCQWATSLGGGQVSLPSEAEWEKAARGTDGRIYPWGNEAPHPTRCNFANSIKETTDVGKYGASGKSPYGCHDMAGNAWEWTRSLWGRETWPEYSYPYSARQSERENLGAGRDVLRVVRGGSYANDGRFLRCAFRSRSLPGLRNAGYGFRVVLRPVSEK